MRHKQWWVMAMALAVAACAGTPEAPQRKGNNRLAACPGSNCVSSVDRDAARRVDPLVYSTSAAVAQVSLLAVLQGMENVQVHANQPGYIHVSFTSPLMGFIDDVEFAFAAGNRIDVRSSARSGYYDFKSNRERLEKIRAAFDKTQP